MEVSVLFLLYGCYMGRVGGQFSDYKRVIAYSTSSQLALMGLISVMRSECQSLSYVEVHAYFKSLLFMLCGWAIHANYVQYVISSYNYLLLGSSVFWCSCVMCGLPFFSVAGIKDVLLLGGCFIFFYYLAYLVFNLYVAEVFRYGFELRRILVLFIFLLPLFFSFLMIGSFNSSVDFYYSIKSFGLRLYVFSSLLSYRMALKDWSLFFSLNIFVF